MREGKQYNTVIFDLDGTLLNTIEDLTDAVNYVLKKYCYAEETVEEIKKKVGNGIRMLMVRSIPGGDGNLIFEEAFETFKEYYQQHCQVKTSAYPGIMEMLESLHKNGIKIAIVSNKAHGAVVELNDIYFKDYISVAIGENEAAGIQKKPAPDSVNLALNLLGSKAEDAIYVGDSEVDRKTAENARMDCVLCSWGFRDRKLLESLKPMAIVDSPDELLEFVRK